MARDDDPDDVERFRPPLPFEDRVWRHPSEVGALRTRFAPARSGRSSLLVALLAGVGGAALAAGALVVLDGPPRTVERRVIERVALSPLLSSPMAGDGSDLAVLIAHMAPSLVRVVAVVDGAERTGSGTIVLGDGSVLTRAGLVDGAREVTAVLADGRRVAAAVLGIDRRTGVAVLDLAGDGYPPTVTGDPAQAAVGAAMAALACGRKADAPAEVGVGVVAALAATTTVADQRLFGLMALDLSAPAGADGGPVIDHRGALVGVVVHVDDEWAFALPVDVALRVAEDIRTVGRAQHASIGIESRDAADSRGGALVARVVPEGPAAAADVRSGDVIAAADGVPVAGVADLMAVLQRHRPGDTLDLAIRRDDGAVQASLALGSRP